MDQLNERFSEPSKPSGQFAKSLQSDNWLSLLCSSLAALTLFFKGLLKIYLSQTYSHESKSIFLFDRFEDFWSKAYLIVLSISILLLFYFRASYQRFIANLNLITTCNPTAVNLYVNQQRKYLRFVNLAAILFEIFFANTDNGPITIIRVGYIMFLHFMVETCIHIQSCFIAIMDNIDLINWKSLKALYEIRRNRKLYLKAAQMIKQLDLYLRIVISTFYLYTVGCCHFKLVALFWDDSSSFIIRCMWFVGEIFYLTIITFHLVRINCFSVKCYDKVYALSFDINQEIATEIMLFLERINRHNIGLTFARLYVITPNFASSLVTISMTLALAAPTILANKSN